MKYILLFLFTVALSGCGNGGGGSGGNNSPGQSSPQPAPVKVLPQWGELRCQKTSSCENLVLNQSKLNLLDYLERNFAPHDPSDGVSPVDRDYAIYQCGNKSVETWAAYFGGHADINDDPNNSINDFLLAVLDPVACSYKDDLDNIFNQYFISTKDYKNEINSN
jgi:hypothetical protein